MKIAVTYENGEVFQHFGRTEQFKVYEVEDGKIVNSEVVGNNGYGHEELATLLAEMDVDVVICGGLGQGAKDALSAMFIQVVSGATGNTDEAAAAYLAGNLVSQDVNCDEHHSEIVVEEDEDDDCCCGGGCGDECGGCGGGCNSGCGGCHSQPSLLPGKNSGKNVKVHYRGTFNDGTQFDSSYDRGEPLAYICGAGMMIPGFDKAVLDMEVGEKVTVHLLPHEAYGPVNPQLILEVKIADMPGSESLNLNDRVILTDTIGQRFPSTVIEKDDEYIVFDANHEMAGKELNFEIELVEVF